MAIPHSISNRPNAPIGPKQRPIGAGCGGLRCLRVRFGGVYRDRTDDLVIANDALSQLSYDPIEYFLGGCAWVVKIIAAWLRPSQRLRSRLQGGHLPAVPLRDHGETKPRLECRECRVFAPLIGDLGCQSLPNARAVPRRGRLFEIRGPFVGTGRTRAPKNQPVAADHRSWSIFQEQLGQAR